MTLITDVRFAHEDGALAVTLGQLPEVEARVVRETSTDPRRRRYYVGMANCPRERVQSVLEEDHTVLDATALPRFEHQQLWVLEFDPDAKLLAPLVTDNGGLVTDARSSDPGRGRRGWRERWLLPDHEAIRDVWEHARSEGFAFDVLAVHRGGDPAATHLGREALTDQQRRAIATAYDRGYFAEPRETSLAGLGETLDLSASAVGGRLKRGMRSLIGATLVADRPDERPTASDAQSTGIRSGLAGGLAGHSAERSVGSTQVLAPGGADGAVPASPSQAITLDVYVEHPDLALSPTIRALPAVDVGVVSDAGTDPDHEVYFFWVVANDFGAVEDAFEADPTIGAHDLIVEADGRRTYGIEYADEATLITPAIADLDVLVHESRSHADGWLLTLHVQDQATLDRFTECIERTPCRYEVFELHRGHSTTDTAQFDLTESQVEALVCAYVQGYYDDPRRISLEGLGSILGVSQTAVSGRLRRGAARLIAAILEE